MGFGGLGLNPCRFDLRRTERTKISMKFFSTGGSVNTYKLLSLNSIMEFIKPEKLKQGDCIAILSPSWGGPSIFQDIYENGLKVLKEKFKLRIKEYPSARMDADHLYNNPELRAKDINDAFADKEIKAIIATIGGDDSIRILEYLDKEIILSNPKIFMGYSDTNTLTLFLNQLGLVTLNGPAVMAGFSQLENFPEAEKHLKQFLFENPENLIYPEYSQWSMDFPDWNKKENIGKVGEKIKNQGIKVIQGSGKISGKLFGGCIEVLEFLNGTKFWPKKEFWKDKILFIETSEEKPSPDYVKYVLRNYGIQGIFNEINGILVGRARDYNEDENFKLKENILNVVSKEFKRSDLPIFTDVDFGHTEPQIILPLGILAEMDCENKQIKLLEKPLKD